MLTSHARVRAMLHRKLASTPTRHPIRLSPCGQFVGSGHLAWSATVRNWWGVRVRCWASANRCFTWKSAPLGLA